MGRCRPYIVGVSVVVNVEVDIVVNVGMEVVVGGQCRGRCRLPI